METLIKIGNHFYDVKNEHFSPEFGESVRDVKKLFNLKQFTNLKSASFSGSDLNDEGLSFLSNFIQIENLDLQETDITNDGIKYLKKLKNLNYLRLKGNTQLTNECIPHLTEIESLLNLQIQETSINQEGLEKLIILINLNDIVLNLWGNNFNYEKLLKLSINMPNCNILVKGNGEFYNGKFEGKWKP